MNFRPNIGISCLPAASDTYHLNKCVTMGKQAIYADIYFISNYFFFLLKKNHHCKTSGMFITANTISKHESFGELINIPSYFVNHIRPELSD